MAFAKDALRAEGYRQLQPEAFSRAKAFYNQIFPMVSVSRWDSRVWIPGRDPGYQWDLWHRYFLRQTFPMKIPGCLSEIRRQTGT